MGAGMEKNRKVTFSNSPDFVVDVFRIIDHLAVFICPIAIA